MSKVGCGNCSGCGQFCDYPECVIRSPDRHEPRKILGWTADEWKSAHEHASHAGSLAEYLDRLKNKLERLAQGKDHA
jgi:hypothetical protein